MTRWLYFLGMVVLLGTGAKLAAQGDDPARQLVIHVELAWMADPQLCRYYPSATVEGKAMIVSGYLPSQMLKTRALLVAREYSKLPVIDHLQIFPGLAFQPTRVVPEQLVRAATYSLQSGFPQEYHRIHVAYRSEGHLIVTGATRSLEQKLQVSQRLRRLPGCNSVVNQLEINAYAAAPGGVKQVGGNDASLTRPQPARFPTGAGVPAPAGTTLLGPASDGLKTPGADKSAKTANQETGPVRSLWAKLWASKTKNDENARKPAQGQPGPTAPGAGASARLPVVPPTGSGLPPPPVHVTTNPAFVAAAPGAGQDMALPAIPVVPSIQAPPRLPGEPYVSEGVVTAAPPRGTIPPVVSVPPLPPIVSAPLPQTVVEPSQSSPPLQLPLQAPSAPPVPVNLNTLRPRVLQILGPAARNVEISVQSPNKVVIQFTTKNEEAIGQMLTQLFTQTAAMPEMNGYTIEPLPRVEP